MTRVEAVVAAAEKMDLCRKVAALDAPPREVPKGPSQREIDRDEYERAIGEPFEME